MGLFENTNTGLTTNMGDGLFGDGGGGGGGGGGLFGNAAN